MSASPLPSAAATGTQHIQNFIYIAPLLGLDLSQMPMYTRFITPATRLQMIRAGLNYKIGHHELNQDIAYRINDTLLNLSPDDFLAVLSDTEALNARIGGLSRDYNDEREKVQQTTPEKSKLSSAILNQLGISPPDEPSQLSDEDDFVSVGHSKTPELPNGQAPFARTKRQLLGLGSAVVGGTAGLLRTASGTALGLGQTALEAVSGRNTPTSPILKTRSEVVLGSPRLGRAGADEDEHWGIMNAEELDLKSRMDGTQFAGTWAGGQQGGKQLFDGWQAGRQQVPALGILPQQDQEHEDGVEEQMSNAERSFRPSRPGLEDDLTEARNGRM